MKLKASRHTSVRIDEHTSPLSFSEIKLQHILVPTDFTECSHKAFRYALSFARQFGADILLLHVVESIPTVEQDALLQNSMLTVSLHEESRKLLRRWQRESSVEASVKTMTTDGLPWQQIVEVARQKNTDLIVAGTGRHAGLARVILGSTAERIVRHAPCPVLVVRESEHDFLSSRMFSEEMAPTVAS